MGEPPPGSCLLCPEPQSSLSGWKAQARSPRTSLPTRLLEAPVPERGDSSRRPGSPAQKLALGDFPAGLPRALLMLAPKPNE